MGCGLCQKICPKGAIHVDSFLATIDYDKCDSCGLCAKVCPKHLIVDVKQMKQDPVENTQEPTAAPMPQG